MLEECFGEGPFVFRVNDNGVGPQLLTQVCLERGWREYCSENGEHWNLWWRTSGFSVSHHRSLYSWQFINHIPKGSTICRKDNLARYLKCMKKIYGAIYDFSPHGYNLPLEYTKLAAECSRFRNMSERDDEDMSYREPEDHPVWIYKPVAQSQGKGIFLFRKLSELTYDANAIVQRYIEKPLLIGGYKFDLRLYVCVPSYHPVTVYLYNEGLARFGTDKFNLNDLRNPFRHLTNSSLNKLGPGYSEMKDRVGSGCKWTLRQLRRYFQQAGISDWLLWQRISSLVVLTLLSHMAQVPPTVNCFEFFGFDVLVDSSLRPWLLEVNLSPALGNDCDADRTVKKPMLHDLFDLVGLPLYNTGLSVFDVWPEDSASSGADTSADVNKRKKSSAISVVAAAGKWRRKQRKGTTRSRSSSTSRVRSSQLYTDNNHNVTTNGPKINGKSKPGGTRSPSTKRALKPITYQANFADPLSQSKQSADEMKRAMEKRCWGNGRDWEEAPVHEGGWIRIWPFKNVARNPRDSSTKEPKNHMKYMVAEINKFSKLAKTIPKRYPMATEAEWSEVLKESIDMTSDIWLPIK